DPLHGDAIDVPSWILDLDMYTSKMGEFNVAQLMSATEEFAARIYRFFRWAVRPGLLRRYGGSV
ncbi:MAG: TIGR04255 family protein, partial [Chloroflexi bacterium]|nr:TIGR04255 family protein [Chloroflexota bacterium]